MRRVQLVEPDPAGVIDRSVERRITIAQAPYAFGAALCLVNTYWSIAFIILVQLNYVIAPRLGFLARM